MTTNALLSAAMGTALVLSAVLIPVEQAEAKFTSMSSTRSMSISRPSVRSTPTRTVRPTTSTRTSRSSTARRPSQHSSSTSSATTGAVTGAATAIIAAELIDELGDLAAPDFPEPAAPVTVTEGKQPGVIRCERLEPTGCSMPKGLFDRRVVPFVDYVEDKTGFEGVRVVSLQAYPHADSKQLMSGFIYFEH